jgi:hypothetical protein
MLHRPSLWIIASNATSRAASPKGARCNYWPFRETFHRRPDCRPRIQASRVLDGSCLPTDRLRGSPLVNLARRGDPCLRSQRSVRPESSSWPHRAVCNRHFAEHPGQGDESANPPTHEPPMGGPSELDDLTPKSNLVALLEFKDHRRVKSQVSGEKPKPLGLWRM